MTMLIIVTVTMLVLAFLFFIFMMAAPNLVNKIEPAKLYCRSAIIFYAMTLVVVLFALIKYRAFYDCYDICYEYEPGDVIIEQDDRPIFKLEAINLKET